MTPNRLSMCRTEAERKFVKMLPEMIDREVIELHGKTKNDLKKLFIALELCDRGFKLVPRWEKTS